MFEVSLSDGICTFLRNVQTLVFSTVICDLVFAVRGISYVFIRTKYSHVSSKILNIVKPL
jgi:hypothetical protein